MKYFFFEYKAPSTVRIFRRIRNKVDLCNQRHETFALDHRTKKKNIRVCYQNLNFKIIFEATWNEFDIYCLQNPYIVWINHMGSLGHDITSAKFQNRRCRLGLIKRWVRQCQQHYYKVEKKRKKQVYELRKKQVRLFVTHMYRVMYYKCLGLVCRDADRRHQ